MSFLSFLFPDRSDDDMEEELEETSSELPELYSGMVLDVALRDGKQLLTGRLTDFSDTSLSIERLPGQLSFDISSVGADVSLRGCSRSMVPFSIKATVQESTRTLLRLKDLRAESFVNQRHNFRLSVNASVSLFAQSDEHLENPEECLLVDISIGGACVQSEFLHGEGEILRLRCKIEDYTPMVFLGQVIRTSEYAPGQYRYGILFAQLRDEEIESMTRILYNLQTGNRREWRQSKEGHWS
ncbi:MAG: hypothetical protein HFF50_07050 [Lawsonibacter sp.]|nr:hypothetical protein [Lawsonibacter sp.]